MTTNCQWCQSRIETYFSEDLEPEELRLFQEHVSFCVECRDQVNGLKAIDPLVYQVYNRRLSQARRAALWNAGPRVWRVALAGSGVAVAALLGIGMLTLRPEPPSQNTALKPVIVEPAPAQVVAEDPKIKADPISGSERAKPGEGVPVPPAPQPFLDAAPAEGPDFVVSDPSGQAVTLNDYRGRVVLFGIVSSDQKEALANLEDFYQAYGSSPKVRIFGVANHRDDRIETTLQIWHNHASKLLGLKNGQFALVDAEGNPKLKGSLTSAADVTKARTQLGQVGR